MLHVMHLKDPSPPENAGLSGRKWKQAGHGQSPGSWPELRLHWHLLLLPCTGGEKLCNECILNLPNSTDIWSQKKA